MAEEATGAGHGTTVTTYNLRIPVDAEVAEVPQDMENLAWSISRALNTMLSTTAAAANYQTKIQIATTLPTSAPEGTIVFLVAP